MESTAALYRKDLATGTLTLKKTKGPDIDELCDFAARANPKRGFLIVSKILGRHMPARPAQMRGAMNDLGDMLPADMEGPVVFLGMAETATALGQGVFAAYQKRCPDITSAYLQTTRQAVVGSVLLCSFEEGHSHATTHLVQCLDPEVEAIARLAKTLVIIDDESSTGNTFKAVANAMTAALPNIAQIHTCCITDWSGQAYIADMPAPTQAHAILSGSMKWEPKALMDAPSLANGSNTPGYAPTTGMKSRSGITKAEKSAQKAPTFYDNARVTVLGDGEHSYEALLMAEQIEREGGIAAVQCITRSPVLIGHAMQSVTHFTDSYGSGAPCFCYNLLGHNPDYIIIAAENIGDQRIETINWLKQFDSNALVDVIQCTYNGQES